MSAAAKKGAAAVPLAQRWAKVGQQVFFDQFLHVPLLYFPAFYVLKVSRSMQPLPQTAWSPRTSLTDCLCFALKESIERERLPWVDDTAR